jgi:hypothetical protein
MRTACHGLFWTVQERLARCWQDTRENHLNGKGVGMSSDPPARRPSADPTRELALTVPLARDAFFRSVRSRVPGAFDTLAGGPLESYRLLTEGTFHGYREDAEDEIASRLDRWLERYNLFDSDGSGWCKRLALEVLSLWCREPMAAADRFVLFGERRMMGANGVPLGQVTGWPAFSGETPEAAARRITAEVATLAEAWTTSVAAAVPMIVQRELWGFDVLALHQCGGLSQAAIVRLLKSEGHAVTPGRISQQVGELETFLGLTPISRHHGGRSKRTL